VEAAGGAVESVEDELLDRGVDAVAGEWLPELTGVCHDWPGHCRALREFDGDDGCGGHDQRCEDGDGWGDA
jgi:hypothetical protein